MAASLTPDETPDTTPYPSESAAVQTWIDGVTVLCRCGVELRRRDGGWFHEEDGAFYCPGGREAGPSVADSECGACGRTWDSVVTPTPAARCPWEYEHPDDEETPDAGATVADALLDWCHDHAGEPGIDDEYLDHVDSVVRTLRDEAEERSDIAPAPRIMGGAEIRNTASRARRIVADLLDVDEMFGDDVMRPLVESDACDPRALLAEVVDILARIEGGE